MEALKTLLVKALLDYVATVDLDSPESLRPMEVALQNLPWALKPFDGETKQLTTADFDKDDELEVLVELDFDGFPIVLLDERGGDWTATELMAPSAQKEPPDELDVEVVKDMTGDWIVDILIKEVYRSGEHGENEEVVSLFSWHGGDLALVFTAAIPRDDPAAGWSLVHIKLPRTYEEKARPAIVVTKTLARDFDPPGIAHEYGRSLDIQPLSVEIFKWNGKTFKPSSAKVLEASGMRTAIHLAEERLRGNYIEDAEEAFQEALRRAGEHPTDDATDWAAYAKFRLGQIAYFLGRQKQGLDLLAEVAGGEGSIGEMARRFHDLVKADAPTEMLLQSFAEMVGDGREFFSEGRWLPGVTASEILATHELYAAMARNGFWFPGPDFTLAKIHGEKRRRSLTGSPWLPQMADLDLPPAARMQLREAAEAALKAQEQASDMWGPHPDGEELLEDVESLDRLVRQGITSYLNVWPPRATLWGEDLVRALRRIPRVYAQMDHTSTTVTPAELDGDPELEVAVELDIYGIPLLLFDNLDGQWVSSHAYTDPDYRELEFARFWYNDLHTVEDLTGDGLADLLVRGFSYGGSGYTENINLLSWHHGRMESVFSDSVHHWGAPTNWKLTKGQKGFEFAITVMVMADDWFDHKIWPHVGATCVYRWDGRRFARTHCFLTEPYYGESPEFQAAELAFLQGRYEEAERLYLGVLNDPPVVNFGDEPFWQGLLKFRLAQMAAIRGEMAEARAWMHSAAQAGGTIEDLAGHFIQGLDGGGPAAAFAGARRGFTGVGIEPGGVFDDMGGAFLLELVMPAKGFEAIANQLGTAASVRDVVEAARVAGLETDFVSFADFGGDGREEVVFETPPTNMTEVNIFLRRLWFLARHGERWIAQPTSMFRDGGLQIGFENLPGGRLMFWFDTKRDGYWRRYLTFDGSTFREWFERPTLEDLEEASSVAAGLRGFRSRPFEGLRAGFRGKSGHPAVEQPGSGASFVAIVGEDNPDRRTGRATGKGVLNPRQNQREAGVD